MKKRMMEWFSKICFNSAAGTLSCASIRRYHQPEMPEALKNLNKK